ncbi:MAG: response regulator [Pseudomonadota bacterium]
MFPLGNDHPVAGNACRIVPPAKAAALTRTVFIIDHDAAVRDALTISLRTHGFGVLSFRSAESFLDFGAWHQNGCLLVELDLSKMSGTDLIAGLATRHVNLPAIIMSARLRRPFPDHQLPSGVVSILQKPFGQGELLTSLRLAFGS